MLKIDKKALRNIEDDVDSAPSSPVDDGTTGFTVSRTFGDDSQKQSSSKSDNIQKASAKGQAAVSLLEDYYSELGMYVVQVRYVRCN